VQDFSNIIMSSWAQSKDLARS